MTNEPKTTAERDYPAPPTPVISYYDEIDKEEVNCFSTRQMRAYYDLGREAGAREAIAASPTAQVAPAAVAVPSDEMVLAAARIISPNLFRHGLHPLPKDGPKTAMNMRAEAHQVRHMLAAALSEAPQAPAEAQEPFGYFRAEPFGWTDCAETDAGAIALYERPQAARPNRTPSRDC